jgi:hypothetical protein
MNYVGKISQGKVTIVHVPTGLTFHSWGAVPKFPEKWMDVWHSQRKKKGSASDELDRGSNVFI